MRQLSKRIPALVALVASLTVTGITGVAAQDPSADSPCVGSWVWRVTAVGQPESSGFTAFAMFTADGGFITERAPVTAGPADAPEKVTFPGSGYGAWQPTEADACAAIFVGRDTDLLGNLVDNVEIRLALQVAPDGQTITGTDYTTVMAPDGTVVFEGSSVTLAGTRIVVKLVPSPAPSASASAAP